MMPRNLIVPERLQRSRAIGWVALLGMLLQLALSIGHIDGPYHQDGLLLSATEKLVTPVGNEPQSRHDDDEHPHHDCNICLISALATALLMLSAGSVLYEPAIFMIAWVALASRRQMFLSSKHYEIRGPPSV
ncbi:hypothetical protein FHX09_004438 [Rhizobium sp. BK538]|uniref:hypothetical protein n=2 Tax=Rhizobium TaxID=379 RepID=UPI00104B667C|nr:hypothetical protein [Rhizobium sp. BK068]MBB4170558.1 hypothetical protein [Rhizobium sp. BK538]